MMRSENAYVDCLLESWARWGKEGVSDLGWPAVTLLAKVAEFGFAAAAQPGPVPEMGEAIAAVERAVLRLPSTERCVIVKHYVHWQPIEVSAQCCDMTPSAFRATLYRARRSVADYLEGLRCNNFGSISAG